MTNRSKKGLLADVFMRSWVERLLALRAKKHLSILAYHSIQQPVADYPYNHEIISAYPNIFERQMAFIAQHFNVINFYNLANLVDPAASADRFAEKVPPNSLIVTFDDGYADNMLTAMPIIKAYDLTAVVYISTDFVDQQRLFWFDEIAYLIRHWPDGHFSLAAGDFVADLTKDNREEIRKALGRFLQTLTDRQRLALIEEIKSIAPIEIKPHDFHHAAPLSWAQIKALRAAGIEVGSHTRSHGFLDTMTDDELHQQILGSKQHIEAQLEEPIISFSYPNGNFNQQVVQKVVQAGYKFAVGYEHAVVHLPGLNPYLMPRIHVETDVSLPLFKANLLLPEVFVR